LKNTLAADQSLINTPGLKIYPNPTNKEVNILLQETGSAKINITDVFGKQLKELISMELNTTISLEGLSDGIYFIHILQNGKMYQQKIIKQ
jgi:hypothetical protein